MKVVYFDHREGSPIMTALGSLSGDGITATKLLEMPVATSNHRADAVVMHFPDKVRFDTVEQFKPQWLNKNGILIFASSAGLKVRPKRVVFGSESFFVLGLRRTRENPLKPEEWKLIFQWVRETRATETIEDLKAKADRVVRSLLWPPDGMIYAAALAVLCQGYLSVCENRLADGSLTAREQLVTNSSWWRKALFGEVGSDVVRDGLEITSVIELGRICESFFASENPPPCIGALVAQLDVDNKMISENVVRETYQELGKRMKDFI